MPRITTNAPFQLNVTYKKVGNHCIFQFQGKEERLKTTIYIYIYIYIYIGLSSLLLLLLLFYSRPSAAIFIIGTVDPGASDSPQSTLLPFSHAS